MTRIDPSIAADLSIRFIHFYLDKDFSFIREHIDNRTLFIGPREGQMISGSTEIINAWMPEHPMPEFSVEGISATSVPITSTSCEVVLKYTVTWHRDDGSTVIHPQILQISWFVKSTGHTGQVAVSSVDEAGSPSANKAGSSPVNIMNKVGVSSENRSGSRSDDRHSEYKVAVMHISNPESLDERDLVYNTFGDIAASTLSQSFSSPVSSGLSNPAVMQGQQGQNNTAGQGIRNEWILIPGVGAVLSRYPSGSIIWIESADGGHKSIVHTRDQEIYCTKKIGYFMKEYPGLFLQPSVSYLVNPLYVKTLKRFAIELWNKKNLRVPEKKYYTFKREFETFFEFEE